MSPDGIFMLLAIVVALICVDLALWVRVRRIERDPASMDDFTSDETAASLSLQGMASCRLPPDDEVSAR